MTVKRVRSYKRSCDGCIYFGKGESCDEHDCVEVEARATHYIFVEDNEEEQNEDAEDRPE